MEFNIEQLKEKIANSKMKVSELDVLISQLDTLNELNSLEDNHQPVDGQQFIYQVLGADKAPGILVPANERGVFSGRIPFHSDSSFLWLATQATLRRGVSVPANSTWAALTTADSSFSFTASEAPNRFEFSYRFIDEGTGRKLFQAEDQTGAEQWIPSRFLASGPPDDSLGPNFNYLQPFRHVFAKNTAVRVDINVWAPETDICRVYIGFVGSKVFGD